MMPQSVHLEKCEIEKVKSSFPNLLLNLEKKDYQNWISSKNVARKSLENTLKNGVDMLNSVDPFETAINIFGRSVIGSILSELSVSQCSGLIGIILSTIAPETTIPLLLKKITEDLEYLKNSMDLLMQKPLKMATEFLKGAMEKIYCFQYHDGLNFLQKAEFYAIEAIHLSSDFENLLKSIQIKLISLTLLESAIELEGNLYLLPIHCLPERKQLIIARMLEKGLQEITEFVERKSFFGKIRFSPKRQNAIDPYLASFYPVYSLAANLTNPFHDVIPDSISFMIDTRFIPEGEDDLVKIEILLHPIKNVFLFVWKTFGKSSQTLHIRYKKVTWTVNFIQGCIFNLNFTTNNNQLSCKTATLDKIVGWPVQRSMYNDIFCTKNMYNVVKYKFFTNKSNDHFFDWFSKVSTDYLAEINLNVEKPFECGRTLLHHAAKMENFEYLKVLLPKFTSVNVFDFEKKTPLHLACEKGNYEMIKLLLESNADVNLKTNKGLTCLMILAKRKVHDTKLVKLLLQYHASSDAENNDGMRAIDYARQVDKKSPLIPLLHNVGPNV